MSDKLQAYIIHVYYDPGTYCVVLSSYGKEDAMIKFLKSRLNYSDEYARKQKIEFDDTKAGEWVIKGKELAGSCLVQHVII